MLKALEDENTTLSQFIAPVPEYITKRVNISCKNEQKYTVIQKLTAELTSAFPDYVDLSTVDGVRSSLKHGWLLIRASGTEPLIRMTVEGESLRVANDITEKATALIDRKVKAKTR